MFPLLRILLLYVGVGGETTQVDVADDCAPAGLPSLPPQFAKPAHGNLLLTHAFSHAFHPLSKNLFFLTTYSTLLERSCNKNSFFHLPFLWYFYLWRSFSTPDSCQTGSSLVAVTAIMVNRIHTLSICCIFGTRLSDDLRNTGRWEGNWYLVLGAMLF